MRINKLACGAAVLAVAAVVAVPLAMRSADAVVSEDFTLIQQLVELMKIADEMAFVSKKVEETADAVDDVYRVYNAAQGGYEELANYTFPQFLRDAKQDLYTVYPGFEILGEGKDSVRVKRWMKSRPRSPASAYEMIGAVFSDATAAAELSRVEATAAIVEADNASEWSQQTDKELADIRRKLESGTINPGQSQVLSARMQALQASQQSRVLRLLARRVRVDGLRHALQWGAEAAALRQREKNDQDTAAYFEEATQAPRYLEFEPLIDFDKLLD